MALDKRWTNTIDTSKSEPNARIYDATLKQTVDDYNKRLASTPGYVAVDWKLMRAMAWVESGGPKALAWTGRVMQIGNPGDPGLSALKNHEGVTTLVVPKATLDRLAKADAATVNEPYFNIEIAIAYLWVRLCKSDVGTIVDDPTLRDHTLGAKETASSVARAEGTTLADMQASNPGVDFGKLHKGDVLHFHKAHVGRRITGWLDFTPEVVARKYNVGDPNYAEKLRYVMEALKDWI